MPSPNSFKNNILGSDKEKFCIDLIPSIVFGKICSRISIFSFLFTSCELEQLDAEYFISCVD